ncbi:hypothetical protein EYB26_001607 [Talaromyces marneffei]|uniref:uncharacterized protein n=1 Tax=Talaromyces marneffei TaxID=37727 RepID=UPI0012A95B79|nr:uncharacterized protein EYB26_001607 [Talaromyces marneffei]QGA13955.1 hypothetical protein EYB26_001607 [Talaromyces marneffei]
MLERSYTYNIPTSYDVMLLQAYMFEHASHIGTSDGNAVAAGQQQQQQQQTAPRASRFTDGPFDESDSDVSDDESASEPARAPGHSHAEEQYREPGKSMESQDPSGQGFLLVGGL